MKRVTITLFTVIMVCSMSVSANFITGTSTGSGNRSLYDQYNVPAFFHNPVVSRYTHFFITRLSNQTWKKAYHNNTFNSLFIPMVDRKSWNLHKDMVVATANQYVHIPSVQRYNKTNYVIPAVHQKQYAKKLQNVRSEGTAFKYGLPYNYPDNSTVTQSVPEPSAFVLLGIGLAGLFFLRKKRLVIPCIVK